MISAQSSAQSKSAQSIAQSSDQSKSDQLTKQCDSTIFFEQKLGELDGKTLSGKEFNELVNSFEVNNDDYNLIKLTRDSDSEGFGYNLYQFKDGLNRHNINYSGKSLEFDFIFKKNMLDHLCRLDTKMHWLRKVTLPINTKVTIKKSSRGMIFTTNCFVLDSKQEISSLDFWKDEKKCYEIIDYWKKNNMLSSVCSCLKFMKGFSQEFYNFVAKLEPYAVIYFESSNQTFALLKNFIDRYEHKFNKHREAKQMNILLLLSDPSKEFLNYLYSEKKNVLEFIESNYEKIIWWFGEIKKTQLFFDKLKSHPLAETDKEKYQELCMTSIMLFSGTLGWLDEKSQTTEICLLAVNDSLENIKYIKIGNDDEKFCSQIFEIIGNNNKFYESFVKVFNCDIIKSAMWIKMIETNPEIIRYVQKDCMHYNEEFFEQAFAVNQLAFCFFPDKFQSKKMELDLFHTLKFIYDHEKLLNCIIKIMEDYRKMKKDGRSLFFPTPNELIGASLVKIYPDFDNHISYTYQRF